jgi:hypothetical protein
MLAFANEACDLEKIKGGIDVIREMGLAVQDSARLLQDYIKSPFIGEISYLLILLYSHTKRPSSSHSVLHFDRHVRSYKQLQISILLSE